MSKPIIQEVLVVEGIHDTQRCKEFFDCDTLETSGTHLGKDVLAQIALMQKKRGVILLLDPDAPGNQIRAKINEAVPGCKNAFLNKEEARTKKKVGVEHASQEVLWQALQNLVTIAKDSPKRITAQDFYACGLMGKSDSKKKREVCGKKYHCGSGNARALRNRLNCLGITFEQLSKEFMNG